MRRVLRTGSKKGLSRRHLEGRSTMTHKKITELVPKQFWFGNSCRVEFPKQFVDPGIRESTAHGDYRD